jgi:hypothetical protein
VKEEKGAMIAGATGMIMTAMRVMLKTDHFRGVREFLSFERNNVWKNTTIIPTTMDLPEEECH